MKCAPTRRNPLSVPLLLLAVGGGCGQEGASETTAEVTSPAPKPAQYGFAKDVPGMWTRIRPEGEAGTDALRAEIDELEALGYADGYVEAPTSSGLVLHDPARAHPGPNVVVSGHAAEAVLMDMDGKILHTWRYDFERLPGAPAEADLKRSNAWRRAHVYPNGDLLGIYEGYGLVKVDRSSELLWYHGDRAHHDLDVQDDGTIYVLTRRGSLIPELHPERPILEDHVTVLGPDGRELRRISLVECFARSAFADVLHERKAPAGDIFHTNTLEILDGRLAERSPAFRKGNALVSLLNTDTIAVVDLEAEEVVWARQGIWRKQHQPTVVDSGNLLLFDNRGLGGFSRVLELDPVTLEVVWSYRGDPPASFFTYWCGAASRLPNGNTLISETCAGRAFEVTRAGEKVWEYLNPHRGGESDELIAALFEVVRLPDDFPLDWISTDDRPGD